ncbi:hypothetical protein [Microbispora sp. GKU 823]|uniref:hypothetical protein n=1 Tax=Microbispora sp. GKU 823 TaxID=1652100 RepID=UPI0009A2D1E3|nr:hypothetical protein [Microbispora sp. GKU 823]OPG13685.1 hypothetical protein B1L11_06775 [Microbispora sp. GKU 823]
MTRLTVAALHRMAKAAQTHDQPTVTIVTHPQQAGGRYACWPDGCILLPQVVLEDLAFPADGSYVMTAKGLGDRVDRQGLSPAFVIARMLPLLDTTPRTPVAASPWRYDLGEVALRLLHRDTDYTAVGDHLWDAWTKHLDGPTWQPSQWFIVWAADPTTRAHGCSRPPLTASSPPHPRKPHDPPTRALLRSGAGLRPADPHRHAHVPPGLDSRPG